MCEGESPAGPVTVHGERPVTVGDVAAARERFGWSVRTFRIQCHSGRVREGRWGGPPIPSLLDAAGAPPDTTHLVIEARDGYRACVTLQDALDGLLALECEERTVVEAADDSDERADADRPAADGADAGVAPPGADVLPRFMADVDPARTVQGVAAIEPVALGSAEDRSTYESF